MHVPAWCLVKGNGNKDIVARGAKLGLRGIFMNTPLNNVNILFEIDQVLIIPHNDTFQIMVRNHHFQT